MNNIKNQLLPLNLFEDEVRGLQNWRDRKAETHEKYLHGNKVLVGNLKLQLMNCCRLKVERVAS